MRKIYALLFLLCISFIATKTAHASFTDITSGTELEMAAEQMQASKIISGYSDGTFRPNNQVTRGQMAKMIAEARQFKTTAKTSNFSDVPISHANFNYIQALVERGIISGYSDGTFRPNNKVTRAQVMKMITNAFDIPDYDATLPFTDIKKTDATYPIVQKAYFNGIASGVTSTTFRPNEQVNRGQAALFIFRALKIQQGAKIKEITVPDLQQLEIVAQDGVFYKTILIGDKIRILPLHTGTGKLFIQGISTNASVPLTDYAMYTISTTKTAATITAVDWLSEVEIELTTYSLKDLDLDFIPTAVEILDAYGASLTTQSYYVGANNTLIELAIYKPGTYTFTLVNNNQQVSYTAITTLNRFKLSTELYMQ